jgi:phenol 2-monooxygenase
VFQQDYREIDIATLPQFLFPAKGRFGLKDYEKVFCADSQHDVFELRSVNRALGCMILVRPDQFVSQVLALDAHEELGIFFDKFMLAPQSNSATKAA